MAPEVLGLVDEELLAVCHVAEDVLLEADDLILAILVVVVVLVDEGALQVVRGRVRDETRGAVSATLDGGTDRGEDGLGAEKVDAAVDQVGDVALGLLDIVKHAASVRVRDDAAKVARGILADPGAQDDSFGILLVEQPQHLVEREAAADVRVQDKDMLGSTLEDGIPEVVQAAGGAKGLVLAEVLDREVGKLAGSILDEVAENGFFVVADEVDLANRGNLLDGRQAVPDDGMAGNIEEGLREKTRAVSVSCLPQKPSQEIWYETAGYAKRRNRR